MELNFTKVLIPIMGMRILSTRHDKRFPQRYEEFPFQAQKALTLRAPRGHGRSCRRDKSQGYFCLEDTMFIGKDDDGTRIFFEKIGNEVFVTMGNRTGTEFCIGLQPEELRMIGEKLVEWGSGADDMKGESDYLPFLDKVEDKRRTP